MWEMIQNMASDRLWIYTAIAGSIISAMTVAYLSTTRIGLWGYAQFDRMVDYLVERWGIKWLEQPEDAWRKKYPRITAKIDSIEARLDALEKDSHPSKELHDFEVWPELDARISKLEGKNAKKKT
jgi:hypothetical protein